MSRSVFLVLTQPTETAEGTVETRIRVWVAYEDASRGSRWSAPEEPEWWVEETDPGGQEDWATAILENDPNLLEDAAATQ